MDIKEVKVLIKNLRKEVVTDIEIANTFAYRYVNDEYDLDTLNLLMNELGYSIDPEFLKSSKKKQLKLIMKNKFIDLAQDSYLIDSIDSEIL